MKFYKGTIEEFNSWISYANDQEGLPNKYTTTYSEAIQKLSGENNYIWKFGEYDTLALPKITYEEALRIGYFPTEE